MNVLLNGLKEGTDALIRNFGLFAISWREAVMIAAALLILWLGLTKKCHPILTVPFAFGMLLINLSGNWRWETDSSITWLLMLLVLLGLGAKTDLTLIIAKPWLLLMGLAMQTGLFLFAGAVLLSGDLILSGNTAALIVYLCTAIASSAAPALCKGSSAEKQPSLPEVSRTEKRAAPLVITIFTGLMVPAAVPLIGMFMLGNLLCQSRVCAPLVRTASHGIYHGVLLLLGLSIGMSAHADIILSQNFLRLLLLGLLALLLTMLSGRFLIKMMHTLRPMMQPAQIRTVGLLGGLIAFGILMTVC